MTTYSNMADNELVRYFCAGQNEAFDELLLRYKDRLYSYISFYTKNDDMADDLFQETFVKAIITLRQGRYQETGKFYAWLTRIAHNLLIDQFRVKQSELLVYEDEKENSWQGLTNLTINNHENEMANEQILRDVQRLMEHLPADQREVVFMRIYQDLSFKEISDITGVSINTALGRMRYGIINMRKMAERHHISLTAE